MTVDTQLTKEIEDRVEESAKEREVDKEELRVLDNDERREEILGEEKDVEKELLGDDAQDDDVDEEVHEKEVRNDEEKDEGSREKDEKDQKDEGKDQEDKERAVEISDFAIEQAVRAGISLADAINFPTEDSLIRTVQTLEQAGVAQQQKESGKEQVEEKGLFDDFPELDPEEFNEETIKVVDGLKKVIEKQQEQLDQFQQAQATSLQIAEQNAEREVTEWFDTQIQNLGDDFTDALGKGKHSDLARGSSQHAKREEIAHQIAVMHRGYEASGDAAPPREEIFKRAARVVLHDEFSKVGQKKIAEKLKKRSRQHMQPAGSTNTKTSKPIEKEIAALLDEKFFSE
jgi:hypothetical protein